MAPDTEAFLLAAGATAAVGIAGAGGAFAVGRRSMAAATVLSPLVAVASIATGVAVSVHGMHLEGPALDLVWTILAASGTVALIIGAVMASALRAADRRHTEEAARQRSEAELARSRSEMIAWASHDLRSPLAAIRAMSEALQDGVASDPSVYFSRISEQTNRTSAMVDDLLALTSLQAGASPAVMEHVSLTDLVSDAIATARPTAEQRSVRLVGQTGGQLHVLGDTGQLSRAVLNLVMNATQYTAPASEVRVAVLTRANGNGGPHLGVVAVSDECGGIPEPDLERVTQPGWRGNAARTPGQGGGAGLGLAMIDAVATAHRGSISVANTDRGCRFELGVPLAP
jgi:signal transduction histidine kinase